jgi:hypothetical protein
VDDEWIRLRGPLDSILNFVVANERVTRTMYDACLVIFKEDGAAEEAPNKGAFSIVYKSTSSL